MLDRGPAAHEPSPGPPRSPSHGVRPELPAAAALSAATRARIRSAAPGYPMPGPQPVAKKGKTKLIIGIVAGLFGLCCVGGIAAAVAGGNDKSDALAEEAVAPAATKTTAAAKAAPAKKTTAAKTEPGIGDAVRDGKFEFVVTKVDCSKSKVGSQYLNKKAQGKFCMISVNVKNIGTGVELHDSPFSGGVKVSLS